jgi:transcriptional regulator with XRE-family HTH domain
VAARSAATDIETDRTTSTGTSCSVSRGVDHMDIDDDDATSAYSVLVGERLRTIRKQKRLSLHDVEAQSEQEFKASVLGAYERGERALSLPRLDRLAQFYRVPVEQLLPRGDAGAERGASGGRNKVAIDIVKLSQLSGAPFEMLTRFLRMIQVQRQDFNGRVLTVRSDDHRAIAAMLDIPVDQVTDRLVALDLVYRPG